MAAFGDILWAIPFSLLRLRPFKIKVTGRLKHYMNAFGEEVIVDNTDKAIAIASAKTECYSK